MCSLPAVQQLQFWTNRKKIVKPMCVPTSALPKQCLYVNEDIKHVVIELYPNV